MAKKARVSWRLFLHSQSREKPRQFNDAYVVSAVRTPVGKAPRGMFKQTRPDDLLAHALKGVLEKNPGLDPQAIEDVMAGCAVPEAEQGVDVARVALLLAGYPVSVPGVTVNRFCSSGLQTVAMAADRIKVGEADVVIGGGVESMSMVPMVGNKPSLNPQVFDSKATTGMTYSMGIGAELINSSQMSDGAAAILLCSEKALKEFNLEPMARFLSFAASGVEPEMFSIGPVKAIPKVLERTGLKLEDIGWIEMNEAFAAQSLAVIKELNLDLEKLNPPHWGIPLVPPGPG